MKIFIYILILIVFSLSIILSCAKKEETANPENTSSSSSSTSSLWCQPESCSVTPSGSISGVDNTTLSGTLSLFHHLAHSGISGYDNTTDCIDNTTVISAISGSLPTGTKSFISNSAVTSSSTIANRQFFYSDTSCSTEIAKITQVYDLTIGEKVTGLSTSVSGVSRPSTATKVYKSSTCFNLKASTDVGASFIKSILDEFVKEDLTVGETYQCNVSGSYSSELWHYGTVIGGLTYFYTESGSSSSYPADWSTNTNIFALIPE